MVRSQNNMVKHRWLVLCILTLASIIFTGCNNGSLGVKNGVIAGYVIDEDTNQPISEVLVTAEHKDDNKTVYTEGDGSFTIKDAIKGTWKLQVEKYGYVVATASQNIACELHTGETIVLSPIKVCKTTTNVKGTLKGYPIDAVTGRAITNFTVNQTSPYTQIKSKTFDSAADFRDTGWTGLEGGNHDYTITANNYITWKSNEEYQQGVTIGKAATSLGTIKLMPLTVDISGTFSNVPGYVFNDNNINVVVWAESAGKAVASYTLLTDEGASKGTLTYTLKDIPVTAGTVAIKCKAKGYKPAVINSAVSIANANPGGTIAAVDFDFSSQEPILADVRLIVRGTEPEEKPSTFKDGEVARAYIQTGNTNVTYADVTSVHWGGEVTISGVITGYPIKILVVNQDRKYIYGETDDFTINEETDIYSVSVLINAE